MSRVNSKHTTTWEHYRVTNSPELFPALPLVPKSRGTYFLTPPLQSKGFHSFTLRLRVHLFGVSAVCECLISDFPLGAGASFHLLPPTSCPEQTDLKVSTVWQKLSEWRLVWPSLAFRILLFSSVWEVWGFLTLMSVYQCRWEGRDT